MNVDITVLVGIIGTITGIVLGLLKTRKDEKKSIKEEAREDSVVAIRLEYISKGIDEIKEDLKNKGTEIKGLSERMIAVEKSVSSAHHRVDEVQELMQKLINKEGI